MKRAPQAPSPPVTAASGEILQLKVWLMNISPMVWRRLLVPVDCTLRELHGLLQVAMGWQGFHLYQFRLHAHAVRYGCSALSTRSSGVPLSALGLRKGTRFCYEYDLNLPWAHEIRVENRIDAQDGTAYPICTGVSGACPPEDCGGPTRFMDRRLDVLSYEHMEDLLFMAEIAGQVLLENRPGVLDSETREQLASAVERSQMRQQAQGHAFSRRKINAQLRAGKHHVLQFQQD
jgi:hypothetical protein